MPNDGYSTGRDSNKDLFSKIESSHEIVQHGWRSPIATVQGCIALITKANSLIPLIEYLETKLELTEFYSSSGWSHRAKCPFHKSGHEGTPSLFINSTLNRYYCQGCGLTGGVVEFIAQTYKRPNVLVAQNIISIMSGSINVDTSEAAKKAAQRKKVQTTLLFLSDTCREFVKSKNYDSNAINYANKCLEAFDNVYEDKQKDVEQSIEDVVYQIQIYLDKYKK